METVKNILRGVVIGTANIIPGVSGGTMALVLGIYERLINSVRSISLKTVLAFFKLFTFRKESAAQFALEMKRLDLPFLAAVCAGAIAAIFAFAGLMTWLLENLREPTYGFFFGLVLFSVYAPYRLIKNKRAAAAVVPFLIAAAGMIALSSLSGGAAAEKAEYRLSEERIEYQAETEAAQALPEAKPAPSSGRLLFFFCAGAVAISAMILPGISGSFILLLMGGYFEILRAIAERNMPVLLVFCLGCAAGLALFTRLLNFLLDRFYDSAMGFLTGLVIGSLWAIWPFKASAVIGGETVYTDNIFPASFGGNELAVLLAFTAGCAVVYVFFVLERILEKNRA